MGDVEEMAQNAMKLLGDEKLLDIFRQNAFIQAKKFDIAKILPLYEKVYNQLLLKETVSA